MLNHIVIMGRMTRDPELRYTQSGTPVASFTLAVEHDFVTKDSGERGVDFIDCVAWRNTGEFVSKYFQKGSMAVVSGRLQIRDWTDREGNKRRNAEVVADNVYFGESKRRDGESRSNTSAASPFAGESKGSAFSEIDSGDGDLPFQPMTQKERIIRHLNDYGGITSYEAMTEYGIGRLASRIYELRAAGYDIRGETVAAKNRYGEPTRYTRYRLEGGNGRAQNVRQNNN